ncbi:Hint domain-containing protein [Rhodobacteraceae bacterium 10Alg 79]|uniref:Hint domain-containing protein n=2 Tax=Rhodalgimonas zhirmunskyi TaxID=2964767 RepID=A0AAJ1X5D2_9RHOB|nr:Hint domain-containing protein [Rhodoalgimonas zhirmunskyi]
MPVGYLVTLVDGALTAGDPVDGTQVGFTIARALGDGDWKWSGTRADDGLHYDEVTDTGSYFLGDDDNVYFMPDTYFITSGSGTAINPPDYVAPDYIVEGGAGDDLIDAGYTGDPEGDRIDAGDAADDSDDDYVEAGAGNDTVLAGAGDDSVLGDVGDDSIEGGEGADTIRSGEGADTLLGGAGDDVIYGNEDDDSLSGGDGADSIYGEYGDDFVEGGAGDDHLEGNEGADTIYGGDGDDWIRGSYDNDEIWGGRGDDYLWGGFNDDTFHIENDFGNDTVDAEGIGEVTGDTLDLSAVTDDLTLDLRGVNPEEGTFSDGTSTASFNEIERIELGGGTDTLVLADGSGADKVFGFSAPVDAGGAWTPGDMLDVSAVTSDYGTTPVTVSDVTVGDDGSGNAVLSFPGGESLTLMGVSPADVSDPGALEAMGIPGDPVIPDYIVEGTGAGEVIDIAYAGDPEGDMVDASDALDGSDDDLIQAFGGDDTIDPGAGDDTVEAGGGDDVITLTAGFGQDVIIGGEGGEDGPGDWIDLSGQSGSVEVTFDAAEAGTLVSGADGATFSEIEGLRLGAGDDTVTGAEGAEQIETGAGDDLIDTGAGDDMIDAGDGADTVDGGAGDDVIDLGAGDGIEDLVIFQDDDGNDLVEAFEAPIENGDGTFTGRDLLNVSDLRDGDGDPVDTADVTVSDDGSGNAVLSFPGGESLTLVGVAPGDVSDPGALNAMGIPLPPAPVPDYVVEGTDAGDEIDADYAGDPEGDRVDASDALDGSDDDVIDAGAGNDTILAGLGDDSVLAGAGDDYVEGGEGADTILGFEGSDTVLGGAGDDVINTRTSVGAGVPDEGYTDTHGTGLSYPSDPDPDNDRDSVDGGLGNDSILTGDDDDTVLGGAGDDTIDAGFDDDSVLGGSGADWIEGNEGNDTLDGGDGGDAIYGDVAPSAAGYGLYQPYELENDGSDDAPENNEDSLIGGAGDDSLYGQDDDDTLEGGSGDDWLDGGIDDDVLTGGEGADTALGGQGDDVLYVAQGDSAEGGDGDDTFHIEDLGEAGSGSIEIIGGEGDETAGDTLNFHGLTHWDDVTLTDSDPGTGLAGSAVLTDGSVVTFSEVENIIICFTKGTRILTERGMRPIETLARGDMVVTRDHGVQPIRWAGHRTVPAKGSLAPIRIEAGVLGNSRALVVSPQHRMLIDGHATALMFGEGEVLASAKHLVNGGTVREMPGGEVTYVHILFDRHEIVYAEGAASESFFPGDMGMDAVDAAAREELFTIFPELRSSAGGFDETARMCLKRHEARLIRL